MIGRPALALLLALAACGGSAPPARTAPRDPLGDVDGETLFRNGVVLGQRGDAVRAQQYLLASMDRGVPEERVVPELVRVLVRSDQLAAALRRAEPYLEKHPDAWALRFVTASIYLELGQAERARGALERVVVEAPEQAAPRFMLAVVLAEAGEPDAAAPHFQRYLELAPSGEHADEARAALGQGPPVRVEGTP